MACATGARSAGIPNAPGLATAAPASAATNPQMLVFQSFIASPLSHVLKVCRGHTKVCPLPVIALSRESPLDSLADFRDVEHGGLGVEVQFIADAAKRSGRIADDLFRGDQRRDNK